jgi:hypothetical protein
MYWYRLQVKWDLKKKQTILGGGRGKERGASRNYTSQTLKMLIA